MRTFKIPNSIVQANVAEEPPILPKYASQIINLANQNAQGTRAKVVGQLSDLIQEFPGDSYAEWVAWYTNRQPSAVEMATERVIGMIENLKGAIAQIDRGVVESWVKDLVLAKTYSGLRFQRAILQALSERLNKQFRSSTASEESKGIDGYIGDQPVSIKPETYRAMLGLTEQIDVPIVYYEKKKDGISVTADFL